MDASCKIQGSIHSFRLVYNMCPELWVHIKSRGFLFTYQSLLFKNRFQFFGVNLADFVAHKFLLGAKLAANLKGLGQKREPWNALKGAESVL